MATIKESAKAYEPKRMRNIADLEVVETSIEFIENEVRKDADNQEYTVSYFRQDGEEFRVPPSVLEQLQEVLKTKPELKTFRVTKTGEGKGTKYHLIPLD